MSGPKPTTIAEYLDTLSPSCRSHAVEIGQIVATVIPDGQPTISYAIPTMKLDGSSVVHWSGWKAHVSIHPAPAGPAELLVRLSPYITGKGTVRFSLETTLPTELVRDTVAALRSQHLQRTVDQSVAQRADRQSKRRAEGPSK